MSTEGGQLGHGYRNIPDTAVTYPGAADPEVVIGQLQMKNKKLFDFYRLFTLIN